MVQEKLSQRTHICYTFTLVSNKNWSAEPDMNLVDVQTLELILWNVQKAIILLIDRIDYYL